MLKALGVGGEAEITYKNNALLELLGPVHFTFVRIEISFLP